MKKNNVQNNKSEEEKLADIYNEFAQKIKEIEEERDKKIHEVFKKIESRQIENIRKSIKENK